MQASGPANGFQPNTQQFGYVPVEYRQAQFEAISQMISSRDIIVVEAAGNGQQDLDHPIYAGRFNRSMRDSGAIMVGAGNPPSGR